MIGEVDYETAELLSCLVPAIIVGLLATGLAWLIPPTRAHCLVIGGIVAALILLACVI